MSFNRIEIKITSPTLFQTTMGKIYTRFHTRTANKAYPLGEGTFPMPVCRSSGALPLPHPRLHYWYLISRVLNFAKLNTRECKILAKFEYINYQLGLLVREGPLEKRREGARGGGNHANKKWGKKFLQSELHCRAENLYLPERHLGSHFIQQYCFSGGILLSLQLECWAFFSL